VGYNIVRKYHTLSAILNARAYKISGTIIVRKQKIQPMMYILYAALSNTMDMDLNNRRILIMISNKNNIPNIATNTVFKAISLASITPIGNKTIIGNDAHITIVRALSKCNFVFNMIAKILTSKTVRIITNNDNTVNTTSISIGYQKILNNGSSNTLNGSKLVKR
jgi:hypothetical protein